MVRVSCQCLLAVLIAVVSLNTSVVGQDKVERRDQKTDKNVTITGKITEESTTGLKMKAGGKDQTIASSDIVRVYYDDVPATMKQAWYQLYVDEDKEKDPAKILKMYQDFVPKSAAAPLPMRRYIEYRLAVLAATVAETDDAKENARKALEAFVAKHSASWQYPFAARTLARLQIEKPDYNSALKTLDALAKSATVPAEIRQEAEVSLIDVMFQAGKLDDVKAKIDKALEDAKTPAGLKSRYSVYRIGIDAQAGAAKLDDAIKKLDAVINSSNDNGVKALAYNIMGDCYMKEGRKRDAMWSYLWVDVVFSQDKGEHFKAMSRLLKIFEDEKDNEKIQLYKDKIARSK